MKLERHEKRKREDTIDRSSRQQTRKKGAQVICCGRFVLLRR